MSNTTIDTPSPDGPGGQQEPKGQKGKARQRTAKQERSHRSIVERYGGHESVLAGGWTPVPRQLLRYGAHLKPAGLTPSELAFVVHLMSFKWDRGKPYPAYKTLAARMGVTPTYARTIARNLQEKRLLVRSMRIGRTNEFDLTPLFEQLAAHLAEIAAQKAATAPA